MQTFRKLVIFVLFLWFMIAILMTVFGTDLFFPFDFKMNESEELYRYKTSRFAAGCILAYAVFRYLCSFKAASSLAIVLNYAIFYLIGGLLFAYQDNVELGDMQHLLIVSFLALVVWFELKQKTREDGGRLRRDYF